MDLDMEMESEMAFKSKIVGLPTELLMQASGE